MKKEEALEKTKVFIKATQMYNKYLELCEKSQPCDSVDMDISKGVVIAKFGDGKKYVFEWEEVFKLT